MISSDQYRYAHHKYNNTWNIRNLPPISKFDAVSVLLHIKDIYHDVNIQIYQLIYLLKAALASDYTYHFKFSAL